MGVFRTLEACTLHSGRTTAVVPALVQLPERDFRAEGIRGPPPVPTMHGR